MKTLGKQLPRSVANQGLQSVFLAVVASVYPDECKVDVIPAHGRGGIVKASVMQMHASESFGAVMLPEVEDLVLVAIADDLKDQAVVIGSLYNDKHSHLEPRSKIPDEGQQRRDQLLKRKDGSWLRLRETDEKTEFEFHHSQNSFIKVDKDGNVEVYVPQGKQIEFHHESESSIKITQDGNIEASAPANKSIELKHPDSSSIKLDETGNVIINGSAGKSVRVQHPSGGLVELNQAGDVNLSTSANASVNISSPGGGVSMDQAGNTRVNSLVADVKLTAGGEVYACSETFPGAGSTVTRKSDVEAAITTGHYHHCSGCGSDTDTGTQVGDVTSGQFATG